MVDEILFLFFRFQLSLCTLSLYKRSIIIITKGIITFTIKFLQINVAALKYELSLYVIDYMAIITFTN
jgi:hypothetical protein